MARQSPRRQPLQLFAPVLDNDQAGTGPLRAVRRIVPNHDEPAVSGNIVRSARCRTRIKKVLRLKEDARFAGFTPEPSGETRRWSVVRDDRKRTARIRLLTMPGTSPSTDIRVRCPSAPGKDARTLRSGNRRPMGTARCSTVPDQRHIRLVSHPSAVRRSQAVRAGDEALRTPIRSLIP